MATYRCHNTSCTEHDVPKMTEQVITEPVHCGGCGQIIETDEATPHE